MSNRKIEFIDPKDLIEFIDENESEVTPQDEVIEEDNELDSEYIDQDDVLDDELEDDLYYTQKIDDESRDYVLKKQEDTRGRLALIYTVSTFLIFLLTFIVAVLDGILRETSIIDNLTSILPIVSGIFLGSLGFVIGYYFRKSDNE